MSRPLVWVVGAGGLLGSHLVRELDAHAPGLEPWKGPRHPIEWETPRTALDQLTRLSETFADAAIQQQRPWMLVWCAGVGVVGTSAQDLEIETLFFERLLRSLGSRLGEVQGAVALASSAGGVYAGTKDLPADERTPCHPLSAYGSNKLRQESILESWAGTSPRVSTLIARISNLYGVGQNIRKPQGLISHISRNLIHRRPIHVYVPMDTIRDYVFAPDCAAHMARCLDRLAGGPVQRVTKIFAAEETVTVARLMGEFTRIAKGHPGIICSPSRASLLQPPQLRFKSKVWTEVPPPIQTPLSVGIQRVHAHHLSLYQQGLLPLTTG